MSDQRRRRREQEEEDDGEDDGQARNATTTTAAAATTAATAATSTASTTAPKKKRREIPKLNADRILSPRGVLYLRDHYSHLRFGGRKGHEMEDFETLMKFYEMWAHQLFPKLTFWDFAVRLHSESTKPRMRQHLRHWRSNPGRVELISEELVDEMLAGDDTSSGIPNMNDSDDDHGGDDDVAGRHRAEADLLLGGGSSHGNANVEDLFNEFPLTP